MCDHVGLFPTEFVLLLMLSWIVMKHMDPGPSVWSVS